MNIMRNSNATFLLGNKKKLYSVQLQIFKCMFNLELILGTWHCTQLRICGTVTPTEHICADFLGLLLS